MKKILKLKRENWDSRGTSLYEAKVTRKSGNTILSIFIGEAIAKKWRVEVYLESKMFTANKPIVDIKLSKNKFPTRQSCILTAIKKASSFVWQQHDKSILKLGREFSPSFKIISSVYDEEFVKGLK